MTYLQAGPELDTCIAEWMGEKPPAHAEQVGEVWRWEEPERYDDGAFTRTVIVREWPPKYSEHEPLMGQVLDHLVEKGYEPVLVCDRNREPIKPLGWWALPLDQDWETVGLVIPDRLWQPTRALAAAAAVVSLMEESGGR